MSTNARANGRAAFSGTNDCDRVRPAERLARTCSGVAADEPSIRRRHGPANKPSMLPGRRLGADVAVRELRDSEGRDRAHSATGTYSTDQE